MESYNPAGSAFAFIRLQKHHENGKAPNNTHLHPYCFHSIPPEILKVKTPVVFSTVWYSYHNFFEFQTVIGAFLMHLLLIQLRIVT